MQYLTHYLDRNLIIHAIWDGLLDMQLFRKTWLALWTFDELYNLHFLLFFTVEIFPVNSLVLWHRIIHICFNI